MSDTKTSAEDVWTVQRILEWTTEFLGSKHVESPRLEAELLLAHARSCPRIRLYTDFETPLTDDERARMRDFVTRRARREPLAYITGRREFYGRDFAVGAGVLVPRPETETLVDVCLERISRTSPATVCEVGFGSGCISITLARQRSQCEVWASDISDTAMKFASENVRKHEVESRVHLVAGDGLTAIAMATDARFDGIVGNPPYLRQDELNTLEPEVRKFESPEALVSGEDGLDLVRELISTAPKMLKHNGWMALEVDPAQCLSVVRLFEAAGFTNATIHKDLNRSDRVVEATWNG